MLAIPACSVSAADPGDADTHSLREIWPAALDDLADDLVTGNDVFMPDGQFPFDDVQIGAADAAGTNSQKYMTWRELRGWSIFNPQRPSGNTRG